MATSRVFYGWWVPADQMHRTHLGRLSAFRAQIVRVDDLVT